MSGVSNIVDLNSIGIVCLIGFCDCSFRKPLLNKYDIFIVTADTVATIADYFGVKSPQHGESYLNLMV